MRPLSILFLSALCGQVLPAADLSQTWNDLRTKREALTTFHQEFEVSHTGRIVGESRSSKRSIMLDFARGNWRERSISGSGNYTSIFDGQQLYEFEEGGIEYTRVKRSPKEELPQPNPYSAADLNLSRGVERERGPCGLPKVQHDCIALDIPANVWIRNVSNHKLTMVVASGGSCSIRLLVCSLRRGR
jgi:hypothetical protein